MREQRRRELRACRPREPRQARTLPEPCTARSWEACRPGRTRARRARDAGPRSSQDAGGQNRSDAGQQAAGPAWTQDAVEAADGIDLLPTDAALGVLRRFRPDSSLLRLAAGLARRPGHVARQAALLGAELGKIAVGRSELAPVVPRRGAMSVTAEGVRSITVGSTQLRVAVRPGQPGPGAGAAAPRVPLLLVNGIGASLELLEPFVSKLDPATDVIRFDPPGVGGSPLPSRPYRASWLCRLIAAMLTELGYGRVDVLGVSWGGGVAQHFAAFQAARCRRLVLASTATGMLMVPPRPSVLRHMVTPRRHLDRGYMRQVAGDIYGGLARIDTAETADAMHDDNRVGPSRGYWYQLAATVGWTSLPFLPLLRQRTLILAGDDDPIIPLANARLMHRLIRSSQLYVYHGGHLGLGTDAAELAPVVDRFLAAP